MKDLNLMFNAANPEIHFVISAGQRVDITVPGIYNIVPINIESVIAGFKEPVIDTMQPSSQTSATIPVSESQSVLELNQSAPLPSVANELDGGKILPLFTENLTQLLLDARHK